MSGNSDDEMERLANRLAMLASESGEADNAGRAVGALARKLGLSGGDLKEIFLSGVRPAPGIRASSKGRRPLEDAARLARENSTLRHSLTLAEVAARNAQRERDALKAEVSALQVALDRRRTSEQVTRFVGGTIIAAALIGAILFFIGPTFNSPPDTRQTAQPSGSPFSRAGLVRSPGANVHDKPDPTAPIIATLPTGTHIAVKRLFWNALLQWAEVDVGGISGFIVTTDVDMS